MKYIDVDGRAIEAPTEPKNWKNIILLRKTSYYDFIFAYDEDKSKGIIYLGHWNDGFVEIHANGKQY